MSPSFRKGLRDILPLIPPVAVFAAVFGAIAVQAGLSFGMTMLSSVVILSGSAQVAMVGLLATGAGAVLLAVTGLALRHVPMSAALSGLVADAPWYRRLHLAWVLVDESFGLTINASRDPSIDLVSYKTAIDLTLVTTWMISSAVGAYLGADLDATRYGAEVIFPLVFLGLAAHLAHGRGKWVTAGLATVAAVVGVLVLPTAWRVTGAALVAALIGSRFE